MRPTRSWEDVPLEEKEVLDVSHPTVKEWKASLELQIELGWTTSLQVRTKIESDFQEMEA